MIVSASYKTDIPAFYGAWFLNRLKAGYCKIINPYGRQVSTVPLTRPEVDGFVFWTRNIGFVPRGASRGRRSRFSIHHTIYDHRLPTRARFIRHRLAARGGACARAGR